MTFLKVKGKIKAIAKLTGSEPGTGRDWFLPFSFLSIGVKIDNSSVLPKLERTMDHTEEFKHGRIQARINCVPETRVVSGFDFQCSPSVCSEPSVVKGIS